VEGGVPGWAAKLVCVGCGIELLNKGFYLDEKGER
jgi:hypothetical protein